MSFSGDPNPVHHIPKQQSWPLRCSGVRILYSWMPSIFSHKYDKLRILTCFVLYWYPHLKHCPLFHLSLSSQIYHNCRHQSRESVWVGYSRCRWASRCLRRSRRRTTWRACRRTCSSSTTPSPTRHGRNSPSFTADNPIWSAPGP